MPHFPASAAGLSYASYPIGSAGTNEAALGGAVTAAGSTNTKGSYLEMVASVPFTTNLVLVSVQSVQGSGLGGTQHLLDIATGPGGSETVVVPNMTLSHNMIGENAGIGGGLFRLRLAIASGTRVACRSQSSIASGVMRVNLTMVAAGDTAGIASFVNYGAVTADSGSTAVDPGGSANTKGSYTQLTASSSAVIQEMLVMFTHGSNPTQSNGSNWAVDIATGAGGAETVLIPDLRVGANGFVGGPRPRSYSFLTYIPASTRLAARASCSITDATDRIIEVSLLCGTAP